MRSTRYAARAPLSAARPTGGSSPSNPNPDPEPYPITKHRPQLIFFRLLTTDNLLLTPYYSLLTTHYSLLTTHPSLLTPCRPELIFLVVQKRTHCRLFTPENGGQTLGNALPGTVIDSQITANGQVLACTPACMRPCVPSHAYDHASYRTPVTMLAIARL